MIGQGLRFGLVGLVATAVHMVVGAALVLGATHPLVANGLAFVVAFVVSFAGHFGFTFAASGASLPVALRRFAVVAVAGFLLNEALLALLLARALEGWPTLALLISTGSVAVLSFVASRLWAFRPRLERDDRLAR